MTHLLIFPLLCLPLQMDMGVGAFVFASAIVSRQTRRGDADSEQELQLQKQRQAAAAATAAAGAGAGKRRKSVSSEDSAAKGGGRSSSSSSSNGRRRKSSDASAVGASAVQQQQRKGGDGISPSSSSTSQPSDPASPPGSNSPVPFLPTADAAASSSAASAAAGNSSNSSGSPRRQQSLLGALASTVIGVSPVVALGVIRLVIHTAVNYQTHVSEYGVHWNFFFTLATVAVLAAVVELVSRAAADVAEACCGAAGRTLVAKINNAWGRRTSAIFHLLSAVAIAAGYQWLVQSPAAARWVLGSGSANNYSISGSADTAHTLQEYILTAPRLDTSLVSQNREGIAGLPGFFAIFLAGVGMGKLVLAPRTTIAQWQRFFLASAVLAAVLWVGLSLSVSASGPVSRRLVNLPYVLWVVAFHWSFLLALLAVDLCTVIPQQPQAQPQQKQHIQHSQGSSSTSSSGGGEDAAHSSSSEARGSSRARRRSTAQGRSRSSATATAAAAAAPAAQLAVSSGSEADTEESPRSVHNSSANSGSRGKAGPLAQASHSGSSGGSSGGSGTHTGIVGQAQRLLTFALSHVLRRPSPYPASVVAGGSMLLEAFNVNFLAIFMAANLLVGLVNVSIVTLDVPDAPAMAILLGYMAAVCAIAHTWRFCGVALKFW